MNKFLKDYIFGLKLPRCIIRFQNLTCATDTFVNYEINLICTLFVITIEN